MKGKRLLAIIMSLCMLLILVPAFALGGTADVTLPDPVEDPTNYAELSTAVPYLSKSDGNAVLPTVDTTAGTITLVGSTNGHGGVFFPLDGLSTSDDFVVSWKASGFATWHSATWGYRAWLNSSNGKADYNTPNYNMYGKGLQYNGVTLNSTAKSGQHSFAMYVKVESNSSRTLYLFYDGALIHTEENATVASDPVLAFTAATGGAATITISELFVYNPNETKGGGEEPTVVTLPEIGDRTNCATPEDFVINNGAEVISISDTETAIHFNSNGDFGWNAGNVQADLSAFNGKEYVEGFTMMILAGDTRPQVEWTVGSIGGTALKFILANSGCAYSGPSGANQAIGYAVASHATVAYAVYVQKVDGNAVVNLFADGVLIASFAETGLATPAFQVRFSNSYSSYFPNMTQTYAFNASPEDPVLPGMPLGAVNYAIDAPAVTGNSARAAYNGTYGAWNLAGPASGGATCNLTVANLTATDEYVISYISDVQNWFNGNGLEMVFGLDGNSKQSVRTAGSGGTSVYTKANGSTIAIPDCAYKETISIHVKPNSDGTTRNINVFINGSLVASDLNAPALPMVFNFVEHVSNWSHSEWSNMFGLRIYKVDRTATEFEPAAVAAVEQTAGITSQYLRLADQGEAPNVTTLADLTLVNASYDENQELLWFTANGNGNCTATASGLPAMNGKSYVIRWTHNWGTSGDTRGALRVQFAKIGNKVLDFTLASGTNGPQQSSYQGSGSRVTLDPFGLATKEFAIRVQNVTTTTVSVELYVNKVLYVSYTEDVSSDMVVPMLVMTHYNQWGSMFIQVSNFGFYEVDDAPGYVPPTVYTVTVPATTGGSVTGAGAYLSGSTATLTATPDSTHLFVGWKVNDVVVSTSASYSFTVTEDVTVVPVFKTLVAIPDCPMGDNPILTGADLATSNEEMASWSEDLGGTWTFVHTYGNYPTVSAQAVTDDDFIGLDILSDSSYVVRFDCNALSWANGWHGEVRFAKIGATKLSFVLASDGFTYYGVNGSQTVNGTFTNSQEIAIYVRREANGKTGIYMNNKNVQLFQIEEDYGVVPILEFVGWHGEYMDWAVSNIQAFAAPDGENAGGWIFKRGIRIVDAQGTYTISGVDGGTQVVDAHSWSARNYIADEGATVTITTSATDDPSKILVVKDTAAGYGIISTGNVFVTTMTQDMELAIQMYARPSLTIVSEHGTVSGLTAGYQIPQDGFTLTATPDNGYAFDHWEFSWKEDNYTENPVTNVLAATGELTATAVYTQQSGYYYYFLTNTGALVAKVSVNALKADPTNVPSIPQRFGYEASDWDFNVEDPVTSDLNVYPNYIKKVEAYTITTNGNINKSEDLKFDERVTVTTDLAGFTGWVDADGNLLSTNPTYTFFVSGNMEVMAITNAPAADSLTMVAPKIAATAAGKYDVTFIGNCCTVSGTVTARGLIYGKVTDDDDLVIGGEGVKQKESSTVGEGQFLYTLRKVPFGEVFKARMYMIVGGTTVYSDVITVTALV